MLNISNLKISIDNKQIIKGFNLTVKPGEIHAIMGPNGAGKSTLGYALAGHPKYVTSSKKKQENDINKSTVNPNETSKVTIDSKDLLSMSPDERAKAGFFLAFQYPVAIPGVTVSTFLRQAYKEIYPNKRLPLFKFRELIEKESKFLGIKKSFLQRYLNDGFSGGEKKRVEILQMRILQPKYSIFDETDSGLDIDALQIVSKGIQRSVEEFNMGAIVITHYQRILQYLKVDKVHVVVDGKIVKSDGEKLVAQLEKEGYKSFKN